MHMMEPLKYAKTSLFLMYVSSLRSNSALSARTITLQTRQGQITGTITPSYRGLGSLYKFYNIPYGKPPIRHLRFAKPQAHGKWTGILDGTKPGPACFQNEGPFFNYGQISEDCLQLNIFVPFDTSPNNNKTVMVWIHGGSYQTGSGTAYDSSQIAMLGDVIVVTINYRLGFFGFMSLDDPHAKGNYGLWDQILAMKWVKDNIEDYGGNPNDITLFGESAGGFSVGLQTLIPSNRGLFHRAILQSGTANSIFAYQRSSNATIHIDEMVGCHHGLSLSSKSQFLNCLRSVDAESLVNKSVEYVFQQGLSAYPLSNALIPVKDNELFHKDPTELLSNHTSEEYKFFQSLDIMVGNCEMEGSIFLLAKDVLKDDYGVNMEKGISNRVLCDVLGPNLVKEHYSGSVTITDAICKKYSVQGSIYEQSRNILDMYSDLLMIAGSTSTLRHHIHNRKGRSTYQYVFTEDHLMSFIQPDVPSWYTGSGHGTDLPYFFLIDFIRSSNGSVQVSSDDIYFANNITLYWTNFAKTGPFHVYCGTDRVSTSDWQRCLHEADGRVRDPNGPGLIQWLPYDQSSDHPFLQLNSHNVSTGVNFREPWEDFWIQNIPKLAQIKPNVVGK